MKNKGKGQKSSAPKRVSRSPLDRIDMTIPTGTTVQDYTPKVPRLKEVERMLARVRPDLERVKKPRRKKSRAVPDGFTAEATEMRVHAANWIGAHGHAYRDLAQRSRLDPAKYLGDQWKNPLAGLDLSVLTKPGLMEKGLSRVEPAGGGKSKRTKGEKANSALILVRQKAGKLKHPPHPAKHVLISRTTGRIRGEQG